MLRYGHGDGAALCDKTILFKCERARGWIVLLVLRQNRDARRYVLENRVRLHKNFIVQSPHLVWEEDAMLLRSETYGQREEYGSWVRIQQESGQAL